MVDWKSHPPPPTPPTAPSSHQHPHHHPPPPPPSYHLQHQLPPPFRQQHPPHHASEASSPEQSESHPAHKRARVASHESPPAGYDQISSPQHSHNPPARRASSPMNRPRAFTSEIPPSPAGHGPPLEGYQSHPQPPPPPPDFHRRASEMEVHPGYGPPHPGHPPHNPHTLGEHMREAQIHNTTPPTHPYTPHHLDTSVGMNYGPHSQPHSAPAYQHQAYQYGGYETPNGTGQDGSNKRKAVRASQACDNCRAKKAKCDEQKPCGNCVTNNVACHFRDVQPPKQERSMLQLTETVSQLSHGFNTIEGRMSEIQSVLNNVARHLRIEDLSSPRDAGTRESHYTSTNHLQNHTRVRSPEPLTTPQSHHGDYQHGSYAGQNFKSESTDSRRWNKTYRSPGPHTYAPDREILENTDNSTQTRDELVSRDLERRREEAQLDMLNGNVSLAPRHFTAANHLVDWPRISPLFAGIAQRDYVKRGEHYHSLQIRSTFSKAVKMERTGSSGPAGSPATHSEQDDSSTISNVSDGRPAMAFVKQGTEGSKGLHPTPGGRNPRDQSLSVDENTAHRLLESYMKNMHILQPFLSKEYISAALRKFVATYCSEPAQAYSPFAVIDSPRERADSRGPSNNPKRRKYSQGPGNDNHQAKSPGIKIPIERTAKNALILLIFALGKACEHEGPLPPLIGEVKTVPKGTPVPSGVHCNLVHQSDSSGRRSPALVTSHEHMKAKRHHEDVPHSDPRANDPYSSDIDRVPGLAYYIHAAQILGEVHGESSLTNVQAQLLAGLYMSQLLRVNDSYRWICSACMTWQMLFKQRDDEVRSISEEERTTFWACLVLESDIVAEHDCIQSGISKWEDQMRYPKMDEDLDPEELECKVYFLAQIAIRKILNRAHSALHTLEEDKQKNQEWQRLSSRDLAEQLEAWRRGLPSTIQWDDNAPLASTINAARLRGKYWGARYVIFRNYLKDVLHPNGTPDQSSFSTKDDSEYKNQFEKQKEAISRAADCIEAAKASTVAFDGIPGMRQRLIVTNPFGTAQAQFSNILVLCAAFKASSLHGQVQQHDISSLIHRTLEFLRALAPLSPTMNTNVTILERCEEIIKNDGVSAPPSAHTSFNA